MFKAFQSSLKRKIARRVTKEYPSRIDVFDLQGIGKVEFANWDNPLKESYTITDETIAFFSRYIKPCDMVIDIGSNVGSMIVPMALVAGSEGIAIGFDPNPYVYKILQKNATLNAGKVNIHTFPFAITPKEEEFYYVSSEASFGNGGISKTKDCKHGKFVYPAMIRGVKLNDLLTKKYSDCVSRLSFIKIDTEGLDKEIIKSIADIIQQYKPVIVAESFGKSTNAEKVELYEVIAALGYEIYYFEDFCSTAKMIKLDKKTDITNWKETINVIAFPYKQ